MRRGRGLDFGFKHFIKFICVSYKPEFFNQFLNKILDFFLFYNCKFDYFFSGSNSPNFQYHKIEFFKVIPVVPRRCIKFLEVNNGWANIQQNLVFCGVIFTCFPCHPCHVAKNLGGCTLGMFDNCCQRFTWVFVGKMLNRSKKLNAVSTKNTVAIFFPHLPFAPFVGLAYQGKHIVFRFTSGCP